MNDSPALVYSDALLESQRSEHEQVEHHLAVERLSFAEPWQPKIMDRVRIRLSGECLNAPHEDVEDGEYGYVVGYVTQGGIIDDVNEQLDNGVDLHPEDRDTSVIPGHFYWVSLDRPVCSLDRALKVKRGSGLFAAAELINVSENA